jgi:L-threonylcarbamoyladenylate synthase
VSAGLSPAEVARLGQCLAVGGVAVIPTDTVYGLACDPRNAAAVQRLYEIKGRPPTQPAAVMFFSLHQALAALDWLGERERAAVTALLPGPVTVLLANPQRRYPLACDPAAALAATTPVRGPHEAALAADAGAPALGLRVPSLPAGSAALGALVGPVLQSSANLSGGPDARTLAEVPGAVRDAADVVLDAGTLPGVASTVLDLTAYGDDGRWRIVRPGPLDAAEIGRILA